MKLKYSITVNKSQITKQINDMFNDENMLKIHEKYAEIIDPWTPFYTGKLHEDITITPKGITYNVPYSAQKYYGTVSCKEFHPLATSHWDRVAMQTQLPVVKSEIIKIISEGNNGK